MSWISLTRLKGRDRIAKRPPESLVVLLHDPDASVAWVTSMAARWSVTVPNTTFIALDGLEQLSASSGDATPEANDAPGSLNIAAQRLETLLDRQLHSHRIDRARLVLVGFGYGGTIALHLLLRRSWTCAGILAIAAHLARPLPRVLRIDCKVRLIDCAVQGQIHHGRLRDDVALLNARGIDARGVVLSAAPLADETVRHGGAYLVELVATAQRSNGNHVNRESSHA